MGAWFQGKVKKIFPFSLSANDEIVANGDNNGDNQSDRDKVLLLLKEEPDITAKKWVNRQVWVPERLAVL